MGNIYSIVEGHGEVSSLPILIRRIAWERKNSVPNVPQPYRTTASAFLKFEDEFKRVVELQARQAAANGGVVLILLDCEDHCPATHGPKIIMEAKNLRSDVEYVVCLAVREFESWFLYAASSLASVSRLPDDLSSPPNLNIRDAKGWISNQMPIGYSYRPTKHQASLTERIDLDQAAQSHSFARLVERLLPHL